MKNSYGRAQGGYSTRRVRASLPNASSFNTSWKITCPPQPRRQRESLTNVGAKRNIKKEEYCHDNCTCTFLSNCIHCMRIMTHLYNALYDSVALQQQQHQPGKSYSLVKMKFRRDNNHTIILTSNLRWWTLYHGKQIPFMAVCPEAVISWRFFGQRPQ